MVHVPTPTPFRRIAFSAFIEGAKPRDEIECALVRRLRRRLIDDALGPFFFCARRQP